MLSETLRIYAQNAATLLLSALVIFVVVGVIQGLLQGTGSAILWLLATVVAIIGFTLYTGFVVRLVEDVRTGRRDFTAAELFRSVQSVLGSLVVNSILRSVAVTIGLILLIIPGLILLTIWAVTAPAIVVERRGPVEAFGRSWELVRGNGWSVFGVLVVLFIGVVIVGAIAGSIASGAGTAGGMIAAAIGNIVVAPAFALASAVMFFDLGGSGTGSPQPGAEPPAEPGMAR